MIDRNMFCKVKGVVDFLRIVVCLLLFRPFGNVVSIFYCGFNSETAKATEKAKHKDRNWNNELLQLEYSSTSI